MPAETLSAESPIDRETAEVYEELPNLSVVEAVKTQPSAEQAPNIPSGEALTAFTQEILGGPLPPEVIKKIEEIKEAKSQESLAQQERTAALAEELQTGLLGKWVEKGLLRPPPIIAAHEKELVGAITEGLQAHLQSEGGQKDVGIRTLREFLVASDPSKEQIQAVAILTGVTVSRLKSGLIPGHKSKFDSQLHTGAEKFLNSLVPPDYGFDDEQQTWQDELKSEQTIEVKTSAYRLLDENLRPIGDRLEKSKYKYGQSGSFPPPAERLQALREDVHALDATEATTSQKLIERISGDGKILSLIARGSLTAEEVIQTLKDEEERAFSSPISVGGVFKDIIDKEIYDSTRRLPEPSLVGLSYTEQDYQKNVDDPLKAIESLAEISGIYLHFEDQVRPNIQRSIEEAQKFFLERADSPNSLYWHFSSKGMDIIKSGGLESGEKLKVRNTTGDSEGVHFVKPGLGIETGTQYHGYAQSISPFNNPYDRLKDPFGLAIIYKLEDITKVTPLRDEPAAPQYIGKNNVSEDVTFRAPGESSEYEYPLERAYVLPFANWKQLEMLKDNPEYTDVFQTPGTPLQKIAYEVAKKALAKEGYSEEWMNKHLLNPDGLVDDEVLRDNSLRQGLETKLFGTVSSEIHMRVPRSDKLVVPLTARPGTFEGHDLKGNAGANWKEELIELSPA